MFISSKRLLVALALCLSAVPAFAQQGMRVLSETPGTGAPNTGKAEDAAHGSGDTGIMFLCVRTATAPTDKSAGNTNGDYEPCQVDAAGAIYVNGRFYTPLGVSMSNETAGALKVLPVDATGATINADTQLTHDTALPTVTTITGGSMLGRASSTAPTAVATGDAVLPWYQTNGAAVVAQAATATTDNGTATCYLTTTASTNATNCKASAGNLYVIRAVNTTGTLYYLRLYNLAAAPTCSSATGFVETIPIPASTSGNGIVIPQSVGQAFATGIGFCLTGGGSSTDNTNAATGVYLTMLYK
jgi:hypothetical protein